MNKNEILLSAGSVPWFGLERAADYTQKVEINPLTLFLTTRGKIGKGLAEIGVFIRKTLDEGKPWSG